MNVSDLKELISAAIGFTSGPHSGAFPDRRDVL